MNEYPLYSGLFAAKRIIKDRMSFDPHIFVFIAGGSATGKTSQVAERLQRYFGDSSLLISMDNYFRGKDYYIQHNISFDEPEAVDIDQFVQDMQALKSGKTVHIPRFDFHSETSIPHAIAIQPKQIMIIEGIFALDKRFKAVSDLDIYVETSFTGRLIRRVVRDVARTNRTLQEIYAYFTNTLEAMHKKYVEPQKNNADMVIHNEYVAALETKHLDINTLLQQAKQ